MSRSQNLSRCAWCEEQYCIYCSEAFDSDEFCSDECEEQYNAEFGDGATDPAEEWNGEEN